MEQWSSFGLETNLQEKDCCAKGHRPSMLLQTEPGGHICIICLSNLISDRNAFLIHRTYAIQEFLTALSDERFSTELLNRHPQFLVTPLADAIGSSTDDAFSKCITEAALNLCQLSEDTDRSLVQDFIPQIIRQLRCPPLWSSSKCYTLHLLGLLLELHCKQDFLVPEAIRSQQDFVLNLITGLQLPSDELQGEILYVLYKLASLEDGIDQLLQHSPRLCHVAVHTLLKTESDELRTNCIALLTVMAGHSLFDITLGGGYPDTDENSQLSQSKGRIANSNPCFANTFAEAIKGSLLSSDMQVQASALQLICLVFPEGECVDKELRILVEEGIVDYAFEIIRLSENQESIQSLAVDVLILLSAEAHLFPHRLTFGLDTVVRLLEKSVDAPCSKLQTDILYLLSRSLSELPGIVSVVRAEELLIILTKLLHNHAKSVEERALVGDTTILSPSFHSACLALISLTKAPCCASIPDLTRTLQTATASAILSALSETSVHLDHSNLTHSASLLQAVYELTQRSLLDIGKADNTSDTVVELCNLYLLPIFTNNVENLDDENVVLTILQTFTLFLKTKASETADRFAANLASKRFFTLSFELMARFPYPRLKEMAYTFLSALVDKLTGGDTEHCIETALRDLPRDPSDLLILLGQRSAENKQLLAAHHAVIAILSTSYLFDDRLAKDIEIVASLEQHLLVNHGAALAGGTAPKAILKQFISLYASAKEALKGCDQTYSVQADRILELVLKHCNCDDLLSSETSKPVLRWFLQNECLKDVNAVQILTWFTALERKCCQDGQEGMNSETSLDGTKEDNGSQYLITLAELVGDENCGTNVLMYLFDKLVMKGGIEDGIRIVTKTLTKLARISVLAGQQLLRLGLVENVQHMIRLYNSKALPTTMASCLELLFQLLYDSESCIHVIADESWLDVVDKCASLIPANMNSTNGLEVLPPLSLINLLLHKSYEYDYFSKGCELLLCNRNMCARLEAPVIDAAGQGAKLSRTDSTSVEGDLLCAASIFSLLRLRCVLRFSKIFNHEVQYIGFKTSSIDRIQEGYAEGLSRISITCEHWCRILYFGPPTLKTVASCCIVEIFAQLPGVAKLTGNDPTEKLDLHINFFMSVTMILQGSILGNSDQIQRNASCCLSWLLRSHALSSDQKSAIANSPWTRMLLEDLILSLSTAKQDSGVRRSPKCYHAAYVAVELLKMSPPPFCLSSLFSHSSLNDIISNLSEEYISPIIVCLFYALLLSQYLTSDHVRVLRDLFQATRRISYDTQNSLQWGGQEGNAGSKILNVDQSTNQIIHSAILELAITSGTHALETFNFELDHPGQHTDSGVFTFLLDTFIQESSNTMH